MFHPPGQKRRSAVVLVAVLFLAGACGSSAADGGDAGGGIATLNDASASAASVGDPSGEEMEAPENPEDAFALFSDCMADGGFDFGDAMVGGFTSGGGAIDVAPLDDGAGGANDPQTHTGSIEDFDPEAFEEANRSCEGHLANLDIGGDLTPEQEAAFEDAQLEFAECMGEQGVDMPEFVTGSGGIAVGGSASEVEIDPQSGQPSVADFDFDFEAFEEAAETCDFVFDHYDELDGLFEEPGR